MTQITLPNALVAGQPENVNALNGNLNAIVNVINGGLDTGNLVAAAGITDGQLASPTSPVWRPIFTLDAPVPAVVGALGTAGPAVTSGTNYWLATGGIFASGSGQASAIPPALWMPPTAADVAVAGKTTRLRLRAVLAVNATAPGVNVSVGFFPISSFAGASSLIAPTLGASVTFTTFTTPAAGSSTSAVTSTFDLSSLNAATTYCFGVSVTGSVAAASYMVVHLALEMRHT